MCDLKALALRVVNQALATATARALAAHGAVADRSGLRVFRRDGLASI
jgi:hypothetical protein